MKDKRNKSAQRENQNAGRRESILAQLRQAQRDRLTGKSESPSKPHSKNRDEEECDLPNSEKKLFHKRKPSKPHEEKKEFKKFSRKENSHQPPSGNKFQKHREKDEKQNNKKHSKKSNFKDRFNRDQIGKNRFGSNRFERNDKFRRGKRGDGKPRANVGVEIHGEVQMKAKGFGFILHKPEDIFIPQDLGKGLVSGDTVRAWINPKTKELYNLEVQSRNLKMFIGTYDNNLGQRIAVLEERSGRQEVQIVESPKVEGLRNGDKVLVEIKSYEPRMQGIIVRTFGAKLAPKLDTYSVVVRAQWPEDHSEEVKKQAEKLSKEIQEQEKAHHYKGRKDQRDKHFITIDGKDARDFDDAVLVEKTASGYVLYVAIADVAEFVRPETAIDEEAYGRATSVYFPEWVIPMLPEALSNGACSLRPNEEKLTLTCEIHFDHEGKKRSAKVYESVIESKRRCIYEDVQKEYEAGEEFWKIPYELFRKLRSKRFSRGALDLDLPEAKIVLDKEGNTIDIQKTDRVDAHKLIEEFMIIANEAVTEIMEKERWPFVYRVHEPPKEESLQKFERFAQALGLRPNIGDGNDPKKIAAFIKTLEGKNYANTLHYLLLRSLKQARYDTMNLFHFGLASRAYTHFTSPIRRYPDLMVHRIIKRYARHEKFTREEQDKYLEYLNEACDHCSKQERKAEELDRKVEKIKKARFMEKYLGSSFDGRVISVSEAGVFVELNDWFIEGLVAIDELGQDYYEYIEDRFMIRGKRTGTKFRLGDEIRVTVLRVDIDTGLIDFTLENADI